MNVVFITIPGAGKSDFAHKLESLLSLNNSHLVLTVVQKKSKQSLKNRFDAIFYNHGIRGVLSALYYGLLLRFSPGLRGNLNIFRIRSKSRARKKVWPSEHLETQSVNDLAVYEKLKTVKPDMIVVWGSGMIDNRILDLAPHVLNYHMGLAPFYRGAVANQQALLAGDMEHIGSTIHAVNSNPDAGGIYQTVIANKNLPVRAMFADLNDRSEKTYLHVIGQIISGNAPTLKTQDLSKGKNYLLKNWTPRVRYTLARKIAGLQ